MDAARNKTTTSRSSRRPAWLDDAARAVIAVAIAYLFREQLQGWPLAIFLLGVIFSEGVQALLLSFAAMVRVRVDMFGAHVELDKHLEVASLATEELTEDVRRLTGEEPAQDATVDAEEWTWHRHLPRFGDLNCIR